MGVVGRRGVLFYHGGYQVEPGIGYSLRPVIVKIPASLASAMGRGLYVVGKSPRGNNHVIVKGVEELTQIDPASLAGIRKRLMMKATLGRLPESVKVYKTVERALGWLTGGGLALFVSIFFVGRQVYADIKQTTDLMDVAKLAHGFGSPRFVVVGKQDLYGYMLYVR